MKLPIYILHPHPGSTEYGVISSKKMNELLLELRYHVVKSAELLMKIYKQGVADGLSGKQIRTLVNGSLRGILSDRQIRRLVPQDLKQLQYHPEHNKDERVKKVAEMSAFPDSDSEWGPRKTRNYLAEKYHDMVNAFAAQIEAYDREQTSKQKEAYKREEITQLSWEEVEATPHIEIPPETPQEIYNVSMNAIGRLSDRLFNYKAAPGPDTDIEGKVIAPSEKYRLRLLKGLEPMERAALVSQISQLHLAYVGFLKHARDVLAEETRVEK